MSKQEIEKQFRMLIRDQYADELEKRVNNLRSKSNEEYLDTVRTLGMYAIKLDYILSRKEYELIKPYTDPMGKTTYEEVEAEFSRVTSSPKVMEAEVTKLNTYPEDVKDDIYMACFILAAIDGISPKEEEFLKRL